MGAPVSKSGRVGNVASQQLLKEFALGRTIGKGAFGAVYACTHRTSNKELAVKMVARSEIGEEVDLLKDMDCKNIVRVHQIYSDRSSVFMVMDKFSGGDLVTGLHWHLTEKGKIPCCEIVHISYQMAKALEYLHERSIVHRDVKGDNYLMSVKDITDPSNVIALADFGAATTINEGERLNSEVGTQIFWSPEFFDKSYGMKVDVWAMGVVMYGLLEGCFPFKNEKDIKTKEPKLPRCIHADCRDYLRGMLTKDEQTRLSSAQVVAHRWMANKDRENCKMEQEPGVPDSTTLECFTNDDDSTEGGVHECMPASSTTSTRSTRPSVLSTPAVSGTRPQSLTEDSSKVVQHCGHLDPITIEGLTRDAAREEVETTNSVYGDSCIWDTSSSTGTCSTGPSAWSSPLFSARRAQLLFNTKDREHGKEANNGDRLDSIRSQGLTKDNASLGIAVSDSIHANGGALDNSSTTRSCSTALPSTSKSPLANATQRQPLSYYYTFLF